MAAGILSRREPDQELVDPHLEQGSLVAVGREVSRADRGYWMVPGASVSNSTTTTLLDWLINET